MNQHNLVQIIQTHDLFANKNVCLEAHTIFQKLLSNTSFILDPLQFKVCNHFKFFDKFLKTTNIF